MERTQVTGNYELGRKDLLGPVFERVNISPVPTQAFYIPLMRNVLGNELQVIIFCGWQKCTELQVLLQRGPERCYSHLTSTVNSLESP